ncbi:ubiquitin carboxyl-terminal hydrolase [Rhodotorula toruloides]|uniref:Ubiquitin carboxyl-terminal hydrolase n=1 Tax=Rhodotorula toruloides TaxID=5286 RepID=A0A511KNB8_RHOTO|nr:ubiquitin carboxyl-terminal hydrolase [Rhodotorula toruloides]
MATPTAGPSRQATPSHHPSSSKGRVSRLNPHSASFLFLQPDLVPSTSAAVHHPPPAPFPYEQHPFPITFSPPPHPNGMYGSTGPYSPYPISSSIGMPGGSGMHGAGGPPPPALPWAAAGKGLGGGGGNGGWNAGPPPFAHHGMHQPTHPHGQPPYFQHHGPPPPPAPSRIPPPPVPPPGSMATNGILFPLPAPQHLPAVAAAAGYPQPGASGLPHSHVHPPAHPPHPLLPPFSPQRPPPPPPPSSAPRLIPAPSLPVSPASPLPPPSSSPRLVPPSLLPEAVVPSPLPSSPKKDAQEGESKGEQEPLATAPPPRRLGIRRRKDHLPSPRDAQPFSFAPHLRVPAGFGGKFRTADSLSSSASATGRGDKGTLGHDKSATASSATSSAPSTPKTQAQTPLSPPTTTASTPVQASREHATPKQGATSIPPVDATPASPAAAAPTTAAPSMIEPAVSGPSAPVSPKSPAAALVKRSWADLVRPPPGAAPPVVPNGITPISASTTLPGAAHPGVPETLFGLLSLPPSHIHQPQAPTPRGLINNGNLCFANATLQALVYCGAFWNLLGLIERGTKKDLREAMSGKTEKDKSERSAVEAMIAFLAEFRSSASSTAPAFDPAQNTSSSANADVSSSSGTSTPKPPLNNNVHPLISPASSVASSSSATSQPAPLSPTPIHDSLRHNPRFDAMRRGTQEDAEEFLGFFLETLHEEVVNIMELDEKNEQGKGKGKAISQAGGDEGWEEVGSKGRTETKESPITRIFGGKLRSILRCSGQKDSVTIEPFQRLQLDIQPDHVLSIEDALVQLTAPESLPDYVTSRGRTLDATKQVFLDALPPVLILHLKRFLYDEVGGVQKSTKKVAYGTELAIDERVMSAPLKAQVGRAGAKYELFGVVYHHGLHASGGHYTVAVRRGYHSPTWFELDDTYMCTLDAKEVAVRLQSAKARRWETTGSSKLFDDDADQKNAYLLLYAKVDEEK